MLCLPQEGSGPVVALKSQLLLRSLEGTRRGGSQKRGLGAGSRGAALSTLSASPH